MSTYETEQVEIKEQVFVGKKGERLTVTRSLLILESAKELALIDLGSIAGFFCEKRGKYYKVRISSQSDDDPTHIKGSGYLLILKAEDTKKLFAVLKAFRN